MRRFLARLATLFRGGDAEREMTREIEAHLGLLQESFERRGLSPDAARLAARRAYGGVEQAKELHREARSFVWVEQFIQDMRYGGRSLRRNPGFSLVAVLALALGIGVNAVIFTVVHAVLLAPLPYRDPAQLVRVLGQKPRWGTGMSAPDAIAIREQSSVFEDVAFSAQHQGDITGPGEPERVRGSRVSSNLFSVLGVAPLLGRGLAAADEQAGAPPVVVLSYSFWQRRFAGNPQALGQSLTFGQDSRTIVGVMPPWFHHPDERVQYWFPVGDVPFARSRSASSFDVVARLRPGATIEQARAQVKSIAAALEQAFPKTNAGRSADVAGLAEVMTGGVRPALTILFAAVGVVLLIACSNVANLLLSRGAQRRQEMALRMALGAARGRLVRLVFTETLMLAAAGGALGLLLAIWGVRALTPLYPPGMPRVAEIQVDGAVLAFTALLSLVSAVLAGLLPALRAGRTELNAALKAGVRSVGRSGHPRPALVVGQIALATVLLACAGLLIKSFLLRTRPAGFNPNDVLVVELPDLPKGRLPVLLDRIRALPGVAAASSTTSFAYTRMMSVDMQTSRGDAFQATIEVVTPDYLTVLGIPLRRGRAIESRDANQEPVALVNEALARRAFPGEDAVGKQIALGPPKETRFQVVGLVGDVPMFSYDRQADPAIYLPYQASGLASAFEPGAIAVRTSVPPKQITGALRSLIRSMEPKAVIVRMETMRDDLSGMVAAPRFYTLLLGLFAGFAVALAALGVYGVTSFAVSLRTHEIGVRMALGASRGDVLGAVMKRGAALAAIGAVIGGAAALAATRLLTSTSLLFRVKPSDPLTFAVVPVVLLAAALVACWLPARRASKVDPAVALRCE